MNLRCGRCLLVGICDIFLGSSKQFLPAKCYRYGMSVGSPLAGPDSPVEQPTVRPFDPGAEMLRKTLVQRACDVIGPSAAGDEYFSDAAHDCLMTVLDTPRGEHAEAVWKTADLFLSRLFDVIGLIERMDPNAAVLQEMHDIRRRCIKAFPEAFVEPRSLARV